MLIFEDRIAAARRHVRAGQLQSAADVYSGLIAESPRCADLYYERALVAQLGQADIVAERDFRTCLLLDPAHFRAREQLGQVRRRLMPFVGTARPAAAATAPAAAKPEFLYAIGSSYVRGFSSTTLFVPLWLGPANELSFITPDRALRTQAHLCAAIDRCDLRQPVVLVMGNNDSIMHANNLAGTKDLQAAGQSGSDQEIVGQGALRFIAVVEEILRRYPGITLLVTAAFLTFSDEQNTYVAVTNRVLEEECRRLRVVLIDINAALRDEQTGRLRVECASYADNQHLSKDACVELVGSFLAERGLLPTGVARFEWSFLWQAPLAGDFQVRIWGEPHTGPSNLVHSRIVAFNHVVERALHVLLGSLAVHDGPSPPSVFIPFCREGRVPLALPLGLVSRTTGADADLAASVMGRRLAHYFARPDVLFVTLEPGAKLASVIEPHDYVFVALNDEHVDDAAAFHAELLQLCRHSLIVLSRLDWSCLADTENPRRSITSVADAVTQPPWNTATILIERRA